ncbi:hypothetical protein NJF54_19955 [Pseudomonas guariconensis]|uniref:hypothetical protein n=1 Tax=Pseudomonas guariconensis TaxID=1288410 RepID=UPI00209A7E35|nr:hypothetical protein [Pseudomonas guariconensis]MCO7634099.1 hypothetical protein [Pseudomonas guariconensis]
MPVPDASGVEPGDWPTWGAFILAGVSLIWQFVNEWRSSSKAKVNYRLARIEALESNVAEIRSLAMAYWLQPEESSARDSLMLIHHIRELSVSASRYESFLWHGVGTDVMRLKIETTGGDFQQSDRKQLKADDPFVKKFMATAADLSRRLKDRRDEIERR